MIPKNNESSPVRLASFINPSTNSSLRSMPRFFNINLSSLGVIWPSWSRSKRSNAVLRSERITKKRKLNNIKIESRIIYYHEQIDMKISERSCQIKHPSINYDLYNLHSKITISIFMLKLFSSLDKID